MRLSTIFRKISIEKQTKNISKYKIFSLILIAWMYYIVTYMNNEIPKTLSSSCL